MRARSTLPIALFALLGLLGAAAPFGAAPARAAEEDQAAELKEKAVMITVGFARGQPTEVGSGVVLCQQSDRVWILTANHVFAGKSPDGSWKQIRPRSIEKAEIGFFGNVAPPLVAEGDAVRETIEFSTFKPEDLLLVSFPLETRLPSTAALAGAASEGEPREVAAVGYWKETQKTWQLATGELLSERGSKLLYHSADVHEGFSGGPLFNRAGELLGVNVQRVPGQQTPGGEPGSWYGMALALDSGEILAAIDKWVPAACLESAQELGELAFLTYRRAMRAVSVRDWPRAEQLMREALGHKVVEGGSVHLEGMRYTRYLPRYHLGLALYKQGRIDEALREWERSEAGGVIQDDKRYGSLKRLREKAYRQLSQRARGTEPVGEESSGGP